MSPSIAAHLAKMRSTARRVACSHYRTNGLPDLNDMRLSLHDSLQQAAYRPFESFYREHTNPRLSQVQGYRPAPEHDPAESVICAGGGMVELDGQRRPVSFYRQAQWQWSGAGPVGQARQIFRNTAITRDLDELSFKSLLSKRADRPAPVGQTLFRAQARALGPILGQSGVIRMLEKLARALRF